MSVYKMNATQTIQFVELYRDAECLWKINSETYKNRNSRDEALKRICDEMGINGFGIREAAQKIKNVRSAYYQEIKKINNSKKSGASTNDIYQPRVPWFTIIHSFLRQNPEMNTTVSNLTPKQLKGENSIVENSSDQNFKHPPELRQTTLSKKRRLKDQGAPPSYIGEAINKLDTIQRNLSLETEFDIWCQSLAKQLNNMDTLRALKLQMEIQNLVSKERIKHEIEKSQFSLENSCISDSSGYKLTTSIPYLTKLKSSNRENKLSTTAQLSYEENSWDSYSSSIGSNFSDT